MRQKFLACLNLTNKGVEKINSTSVAMREHNLRMFITDLGNSLEDCNIILEGAHTVAEELVNNLVVDEVSKGIYVLTIPENEFNEIGERKYSCINRIFTIMEMKGLVSEFCITQKLKEKILGE